MLTVVPNDEAFVFASYTEGYRQYFYFEMDSAEVGGGSVYKNSFTWDLAQFNYNFDRIQLGGPATLARSAVTNAAGYALFNVSGNVTLPATMTFRADALPDAVRTLP